MLVYAEITVKDFIFDKGGLFSFFLETSTCELHESLNIMALCEPFTLKTRPRFLETFSQNSLGVIQ